MRKVIVLLAVILTMLIACQPATETKESDNNNNNNTNQNGNNNNQGGNNVTPQVSYAVNFNAESLSWDKVYVFAWDESGNNADWPGVKMATGDNNWYNAVVKYPNLIFNNGSDQQTVDLTSQDGYFIPESTNSSGKITGTWYKSNYSVNFYAGTSGWDTVYVFAWDGTDTNAKWPGVEMSVAGDGWYSANVNYSNIIFNNGSDQQTIDLKSQNGYFAPENVDADGMIVGTWYISKPTSNGGSDNIYGEWIDEDLDLVYTINKDGTYSIIQGGILIESGTFEVENVDSRVLKRGKIQYGALITGGAKKSTKAPKATEKTIAKSTENETIFIGNTSLVQKDSSLASKTESFYVYVRSDVVPQIQYLSGEVWAEANIVNVTCAAIIDGKSYRWYKFVIEDVDSIVIVEGDNYDLANRIVFDPNSPYCIYDGYQGECVISKSKPDDIFSDEDYAGRDNFYYICGNFEAEGNQYLATDGFNNMEEIEENIFKGTLYLAENVYGFKVSKADWEYDYCVPFDMGFVPKNEWFNVVRSEYSTWYGKNAALSTAGGMYTFILDLTDSENPQMMISSDEEDYEISNEDSALYVLGSFNDWKYDSSNGMMTETFTGIYEGTIDVSTVGICEFKIADKAWGGIIDDIGFSWWNDASREIILDIPTVVDGAYTTDPKGSTENIVIDFVETGIYKVSLEKGYGNYTLTVSKQ